MKDVTSWLVTGYGENSTLEKLDLLSSEGEDYVIKFPRDFDGKRTNWEDVNEVIAAKIASLLDLPVIDAEVAYRNGRRACLMKNFKSQLKPEIGDTAASLLYSEFGREYDDLQTTEWKDQQLLNKFFDLFEKFSLHNELKKEFIWMNLFDILIGNQDRHGHNWQILFIKDRPVFAPLYDNGASLGWQLSENEIERLIKDEVKMNKFYKNTLVKMGMDNKESPRIKAKLLLNHVCFYYREEAGEFFERLSNFDIEGYGSFLEKFPLISSLRKEFLMELIKFRKMKMEEVYEKGGSSNGNN